MNYYFDKEFMPANTETNISFYGNTKLTVAIKQKKLYNICMILPPHASTHLVYF